MKTISATIADLCNQIELIEQKYQRETGSVQILAVSKRQGCEKIAQAYEAGLHHFGENFIDEALDKITTLQQLDITWHFIGSLQSNKTKHVAQ